MSLLPPGTPQYLLMPASSDLGKVLRQEMVGYHHVVPLDVAATLSTPQGCVQHHLDSGTLIPGSPELYARGDMLLLKGTLSETIDGADGTPRIYGVTYTELVAHLFPGETYHHTASALHEELARCLGGAA